jgi:hypothetical protein
MTDELKVESAGRAVLDRIDRAQRRFQLAFFGAVAAEAGLLAAFVLLADFRERLQALLFLSTVGIYTIVVLGLVALGAWQRRSTLLVLDAVELLSDDQQRAGAGGRRS